MKKSISILFLMLIQFVSAQHAEEFVQIQSYFNNQREQISNRFKYDYDKEIDLNTKKEIHYYYGLFMKKMDSVQNAAYLNAMIKIRNGEDLNRIKDAVSASKLAKIKSDKHLSKPSYPGGINQLSIDINQLFYRDFYKDYNGTMSAMMKFMITPEGNVSFVEADGDHMPFNIQATIAMYLLPKKFIPAKYKGEPIAYEYQFPIKFKFDE